MAPSMNRFCVVVLLVLIASTSLFVDKAQARGFHSCMNVCRASYLLCANFCFASSLGYNEQLMQQKTRGSKYNKDLPHYQAPKVQGEEKHLKHSYPKHPHSKHNKNLKLRHSKHSKHAHH
ncbi:hypothetical protein MKX03_032799 [Papaver bracteatum]|nr:hypothetical protein MKX03_032799 [Papaver bracteatum]